MGSYIADDFELQFDANNKGNPSMEDLFET